MNELISKPDNMSDEFYNLCLSVSAKRAKTVITHILKYGFITNEDLTDLYGYNHPPRAIRDVREHGIPLITYKVPNKTGRIIGAYRFGNELDVIAGRIGGRKAFSKQFKEDLINYYGSKSNLNGESIDARYLQIDHRVPYEVSGNIFEESVNDYMLLDASDQRAKSWSCEHCVNLAKWRDISLCSTCFWAYPEKYTHIAMKQQRRIDIVWNDSECCCYDDLLATAERYSLTPQNLIKEIISKFLMKM